MKKRTHKYWTMEELMKEASRFNKRGAFYTHSKRAYSVAYNSGLLDKVCAHMAPSQKKNKFVLSFPNHTAVLGPALKYTNTVEFRVAHNTAYEAGVRWGIDWQEFFENVDNASYLRRLISVLAENAATGQLNLPRNLMGDVHRGAPATKLNLEDAS